VGVCVKDIHRKHTTMNDEITSHEEDLTELIDEMDIDDVRIYFTDLMQASLNDDPNTEVAA